MIEFPHTAPTNHSYEFVEFKRNVVAIWIHNHYSFVYKGGESVSSIWGFYHTKKKVYYAPVNSKTVGKEVNISDTTPYSAMIPKQSVLEQCMFQR